MPGTEDQFLINPYGLFFDEITASSLVKIDLEGKKIGDSPFPVNAAGFVIHSAIHAARHDAHCVLHTHTVNGVAVSAQRAGCCRSRSTRCSCSAASATTTSRARRSTTTRSRAWSPTSATTTRLILRNHGLLTVGETVAEAFMRMYYLETSCAIQVRAQSGGGELIPRPKEVMDAGYANAVARAARRTAARAELVWPGLLRRLDRTDPSFRN